MRRPRNRAAQLAGALAALVIAVGSATAPAAAVDQPATGTAVAGPARPDGTTGVQNAWVRLRSLYGNQNQCLDGNGGTYDGYHHVIVNTCNGSPQQRWYLHNNGGWENGAYYKMCLDADVNGHFNGTRVQLWSCNGSWQQNWYGLSNDLALYNKHFWMVNPHPMILDRDANHPGDGAKVQMWERNFKPQQWWRIEVV